MGCCSGLVMEIRLEFIMFEEGIVMEVFLGGDGIVDRLWWLNVSLFCLWDYLLNIIVDCVKKFGMFVFLFC